ncbi:uncharacterized protein [Anas platyrhynchos]|uniref:uncharacterized protein n=1 Tax=Anas platyrhynchos TaxID=8839 RepID=UPI003AF30784
MAPWGRPGGHGAARPGAARRGAGEALPPGPRGAAAPAWPGATRRRGRAAPGGCARRPGPRAPSAPAARLPSPAGAALRTAAAAAALPPREVPGQRRRRCYLRGRLTSAPPGAPAIARRGRGWGRGWHRDRLGTGLALSPRRDPERRRGLPAAVPPRRLCPALPGRGAAALPVRAAGPRQRGGPAAPRPASSPVLPAEQGRGHRASAAGAWPGAGPAAQGPGREHGSALGRGGPGARDGRARCCGSTRRGQSRQRAGEGAGSEARCPSSSRRASFPAPEQPRPRGLHCEGGDRSEEGPPRTAAVISGLSEGRRSSRQLEEQDARSTFLCQVGDA